MASVRKNHWFILLKRRMIFHGRQFGMGFENVNFSSRFLDGKIVAAKTHVVFQKSQFMHAKTLPLFLFFKWSNPFLKHHFHKLFFCV